MCSVNLLDRLHVGKSQIKPDSVFVQGFDNTTEQLLSVITLPITIGVATLQTPIHVMPYDLSYNLLLGRPWIHEMNAVPSTLHRIMKYVYNNKIYQVEIDLEPESCVYLEKGATSPLRTLIPTSNIDPLEIEKTMRNQCLNYLVTTAGP